jgi:hypothetical protein
VGASGFDAEAAAVNNPPRGQSYRTTVLKNRQPKTVDADTLAREADELRQQSGHDRTWSREGTLEVHAWSQFFFREIAPGVRANHRYYHRRKRLKECGALCEARDVFAVILLGFQTVANRTALPLVGIIVSQIERLCGAKIDERNNFHRQARRYLTELRKLARHFAPDRGKAAPALVRRYPEAFALIQHAAGRLGAPTFEPA